MESLGAVEHLPNGHVLIAGGGPVGLLLALVLAHHGQHSVLLEQNVEATRYKMNHHTNIHWTLLTERPGIPRCI